MMDELVCVVCGTEKNEKVVLFSEETLRKCEETKSVRAINSLAYADIKLPATVSNIRGYHSKCYSRFTALKKKYIEGEASAGSTGRATPERGTSNVATQTPTKEDRQKEDRPTTPTGLECPPITMDAATQTPTKTPHPSRASQTLEGDVLSVEDEEDGPEGNSPLVCLFCHKDSAKKKRGRRSALSFVKDVPSFKTVIEPHALRLNDEATMRAMSALTAGKPVCYHKHCKLAYCRKATPCEIDDATSQSEWHGKRSYHKMAFDELCQTFSTLIFEKKKCYLLTSVTTKYKNILSRIMGEKGVPLDEMKRVLEAFTNQTMKLKFTSAFQQQIKIVFVFKHYVLAASDVTVDEDAVRHLMEERRTPSQQVAASLRQTILEIEKQPIPDNPSAENLINGECDIPQDLVGFLSGLIVGENCKAGGQTTRAHKVQSIAQDIVYNTRLGRIKTSKHITLGIVMKSLTSSRKVVDILNRYGHCCSYNAVEELETEITFASADRLGICPDGIQLCGGLNTGVAFDNFDRFVETRSGKDTLHDTVGIIFQDKKHMSPVPHSVVPELDPGTPELATPMIKKRKRRAFEAITPELESYPKKPRMADTILPVTHELRRRVPANLNIVKSIDVIWMLLHALEIPDTPMWVGFNSLVLQDESPMQTVKYLTPMNESPTKLSVVLETLVQAQKVAQECNEQYAQVTYDLAIAKVALQIQVTERPRFDNVFIHLGSFHTMMAYFKAVGKYIEDCGLTYIMIESDILASGSVNGFITGTHFNRCKRLHPLVALCVEILHFRAFLADENVEIDELLISELTATRRRKVAVGESPFNENGPLALLIERYSSYRLASETGDHGKTPQFYIMYVNFVNYFLLLSRSIRSGDFDLLKYVLPNICNLFFLFNQPNYARWLVKYHHNLLQAEASHPGLELSLQQGSFGIKRTEKCFSNQPIDLTLEQTVNADAARQLTGMTNSISARQRWARSHALRATLISQVLHDTGLKRSQDVTAELERHNMIKNSAALQRLLDCVQKTMNPFSKEIDKDCLVNIATGRAASTEIADFLTSAEITGKQRQEEFIDECSLDNERFERPIKKNRIYSFVAAGTKSVVKLGTKVQEIKMQRDLFGRMFAVSLDQKVDAAKILSFPLTPVPMSLCHLDGTMCKTDKSSVLRMLEKKITSEPPRTVDVLIVDGVFMLHLMKDVPKTFGNLSKKFLQMVLRSSAPTVYIVFDQYKSPSIKDNERARRCGYENRTYSISGPDQVRPRRCGYENRTYSISGPDQVRPHDFAKELRNQRFKESLIRFFIAHWSTDEVAPFIGAKTVFLDFDNCYRYVAVNKETIETSTDPGKCTESHEEADTKVVYHVCNMNVDEDDNVVVRCSDTDILIIMLGNIHKVKQRINIWLDVGVGNNQRVINASALHSDLGDNVCRALPGFHALTGCDYNPAFFKKGKTRPLNVLLRNPEFHKAFIQLSDEHVSPLDQQDTFKLLERFVCNLYGLPNCRSVNDGRFQIFSKIFKIGHINEPFIKYFKNVDASNLPPAQAELTQQLLRAQYISRLWSNAYRQQPTNLDPRNYGWREKEGLLELVWFEGEQCPPLVHDVIVQKTIDTEEEAQYDEEHVHSDETDEEQDDTDSDYSEGSEDQNLATSDIVFNDM